MGRRDERDEEAGTGIELGHVIEALRGKLAQAMQQGTDEEVQFDIQAIELELEVGVTRGGADGSELTFWVAELDAPQGRVPLPTQTLKLVLSPRARQETKGEALPSESPRSSNHARRSVGRSGAARSGRKRGANNGNSH